MFFGDPQEAIRASFSDGDKETANALLLTCRSRLTGREEQICESIASTAEEDFDSFSLTREEQHWFESLKIQFAAEIGAAMAGRAAK